MTLLFNEKSIDLIHKYAMTMVHLEQDGIRKGSVILGYINNPSRTPLKPLLAGKDQLFWVIWTIQDGHR